VRHRLLLGADQAPDGWLDYTALVEANRGRQVPCEPVGPDDLQRLMYTSGTTSRPKGVCITHGNLTWKNLGHIVEFGLTADDTTLVCGPLYHVGGFDLPGVGTLHRSEERRVGKERSARWTGYHGNHDGAELRRGAQD